MMTRKTTDMAGLLAGVPAPDWAAMLQPQTRMAEAMLHHNIEMLDFVRARLERDREFLGVVSKAGTPAEAMGLWQGFWQKMIADYASETDKLAASAARLSEEAVRGVTEAGSALIKNGKTE